MKTPYGIVKLMSRTLALLIVNAQGLSVFSLNETRSANISVENGGLLTSLCVGQCLHLTTRSGEIFEELNSVQFVKYRNVIARTIGPDLTVFSAEYSISSLIGGLAPLRDMFSSPDKERRVVANNMLKRAAL